MPNLDTNNISIDVYLSVEVDLSVKAYRKGEIFPISQIYLSDTRQLEMLLEEISFSPLNTSETKNINSNDFHITSGQNHIQQVIDIQANVPEDELHNCPKICRLQFINCQLENSLIPKNRRRYNILTQILSLKTHLIAPTFYRYLQRISCLSLPHFNTLEKLYSSFGLENEFFSSLNNQRNRFPQSKSM